MRPNRIYQGVYELKDKKRILLTKNAVPGQQVYGERLVKLDEEYREWDPTKSKLAAAILKGISQMPIKEDSTVLYLGASHGTTVSHLSDMITKGAIFALDFAPRVLRDLVFLCETRNNIIPLMADANQPKTYAYRILPADIVYQDVAQKNQADIFLKNCRLYLRPGGFGMLAVKSRSVDITASPKAIYQKVRQELEKEMTVIDYKILDPYEKDHCMFIVKR